MLFAPILLKATLDEGLRSNKMEHSLLVESHKLNPRPLNEDPRSIEAKLRWYLHGTILEGNSIGPDQKVE